MRASWLLSTTAALTLLWLASGLIIMEVVTATNCDPIQDNLAVSDYALQRQVYSPALNSLRSECVIGSNMRSSRRILNTHYQSVVFI